MMIMDNLKDQLTMARFVLFRGTTTHEMLNVLKPVMPIGMAFVPKNKELYDLCLGLKVPIAHAEGTVLAEGDGEGVLQMLREYPGMWYVLERDSGKHSREFMSSFSLVIDFMDGRVLGVAKYHLDEDEERR